jgi:single-stranded DNA-binding protein
MTVSKRHSRQPRGNAGLATRAGRLVRTQRRSSRDGERRSKVQVVADAVQFLGQPGAKATAETDEQPADKRSGRYRKAS